MFQDITIREFMTEVDIMDLGNTWSVMSTDSGKEKASLIVGWRAVGTHLNKPVFTIYIHKSRYSQHVFDDAGAFSVSFFIGQNKKDHIQALQFLGTKSGRDVDKLAGAAELGLTICNAEAGGQQIPYYAEADYVILCKKIAQTEEDISTIDHADPMYSWLEKEGSHHIYNGQILQVMKNTEIHP